MKNQPTVKAKKEGQPLMATPNTQKNSNASKAATPPPAAVKASDGQVLAAAAPAETKAKRGRVKKDDMPFNIYFINDKNESSSRVPDSVTAVQVKGSDNKVKNILLTNIPDDIKNKLIADGLKKRLLPYVKDVKKTNLEELYTLADKFASDVVSGKLYAKSEDAAKPGRSFDVEYWCDVAKLAAEINVKNNAPKSRLMTEDDRKSLTAKLEAMTPKDRNDMIKLWKTNKVMLYASIKVRQQRDEAKLAKMSGDADFDVADLF